MNQPNVVPLDCKVRKKKPGPKPKGSFGAGPIAFLTPGMREREIAALYEALREQGKECRYSP